MKTFSYFVKKEILKLRYEAFCCASSSLCAIFQTLGEFVFRNGKLTLSLVIDHDDMFDFLVETIEKFYGNIISKTEIHATSRMGNIRKEWVIEPDLAQRLLFDTGLISLDNGTVSIHSKVDKTLVLEDCCKIAYLSHAFVGAGTVSLPSEGGGYHMEWATKNDQVAKDISSILTDFGIFPKSIKRNDRFVVYLKDRDTIAELLGRFGAVKAMLKLEEASVERDMRNRVNRSVNCMAANISKTLEASTRQLNAINIIEQTIGLDSLSTGLRDMSVARKADPSASILDLGKALNISKSAARHRLNALIQIADNLV